MKLTKKRDGKKLTVTIEGNLDAKTAPELEEALKGELEETEELFFDMRDMEYTSSVGLRVLLNAYQEIDEKEGRMVMQHLNDDVKEILDLTGFTDFLEIED